ncbi:hypothetical protein NRIC_21260 [Enterococcus florum]|uniref:Uncharacterized protein n=1 Tax=Enterococcus florum TaxID=2480627 RepID=A0A4P5P895_9ENTE|nr:hypothetical protein [Enterococcus florum]GCF94235.1 hypothetical protein NRIC_21260 [Enterococcus florum]
MKRFVILLVGICLLAAGCGNEGTQKNTTEKSSEKVTKTVEKKAETKQSGKTTELPLSLGADETGKLPEENGEYTPYLTVAVPDTYGCLTYSTVYEETDVSGETEGKEYYTVGSPNVKDWMEEDEQIRYSGMPYSYVCCLDDNNRSTWFHYQVFNEKRFKKMQEQYPTSDFSLYDRPVEEKQMVQIGIDEGSEKSKKAVKDDKGKDKAAGFAYTYDYLMVQDEDKEQIIYCDYQFDLGDGSILYYSLKAYESEMKVADFDPEQHGKEIAESITLK